MMVIILLFLIFFKTKIAKKKSYPTVAPAQANTIANTIQSFLTRVLTNYSHRNMKTDVEMYSHTYALIH